jgi:large subunit ribosomal protein L10
MLKERKHELVDELAKNLGDASTLIVADYRGLSVGQFDELRTELYKHGARFTVVKNTLTMRAAEKAGIAGLDEFLSGPSAVAFITDGDMIATAKALVESAKETKILTLKGGLLDGRRIDGDDVHALAELPPFDILQGTVVGVIAAPLTHFVSLIAAPLRDVVGVLDARIQQLGEQGDGAADAGDVSAEAPAEDNHGDVSGAGDVEAEPPADAAAASEDDAPTSQASEDPESTIENSNAEENQGKEDDDNGDN